MWWDGVQPVIQRHYIKTLLWKLIQNPAALHQHLFLWRTPIPSTQPGVESWPKSRHECVDPTVGTHLLFWTSRLTTLLYSCSGFELGQVRCEWCSKIVHRKPVHRASLDGWHIPNLRWPSGKRFLPVGREEIKKEIAGGTVISSYKSELMQGVGSVCQ